MTQVERPPVSSRDSDPAAPPRAATDDRQISVLGRVDRASVHPTAGRIVGGGSLCLLLTAQSSGTEYPVKAAGPPLILQGYIPAGAPGGAWSKVFVIAGGVVPPWSTARDPYGHAKIPRYARDDRKGYQRFKGRTTRSRPGKRWGGSAFEDRPRATISEI